MASCDLNGGSQPHKLEARIDAFASTMQPELMERYGGKWVYVSPQEPFHVAKTAEAFPNNPGRDGFGVLLRYAKSQGDNSPYIVYIPTKKNMDIEAALWDEGMRSEA